MGSISNYLEDKLLDHIFNSTAYNPPSTVFVGLSTADPLDDASGLAEPSGNGYGRKAITFSAASARSITQSATVTFPQATGSWGTITHFGLFDSTSAGNMIGHGQLNTQKSVGNGNTPSIASGEVIVSFDSSGASNYLANALLDFAFRNQSYSQPDTYIGLITADASDSDTGSTITEVSGSNYGRALVSESDGTGARWETASGGHLQNATEIIFPQATGSWGTCTGTIIADATTAGNLLFYNNGAFSESPDNGDIVKFPVGDFDITLT